MQALILLLAGAGVLRITLFGDVYLRYVKEGLRPFLIASGVLLVLTALAGLRKRTPAGCPSAPIAHDGHPRAGAVHDHGSAPRVAWLLVPPALAMLAFAPPALGSYTANRESAKRVEAGGPHFAPLPKGAVVPLTLTEFLERSGADPASMRGRTVQLVGFVTPEKSGAGWRLTRLVVTCCAADSQALQVPVRGAAAPPADAWVTVTGMPGPRGSLAVERLRRIAQPPNPYMDALPPPST
ncbi:TIGR03943 family protein [Streptomyces sp. WMMC500]|uniref:TIGR03943 family putative permease subunit n=1 Tax=Streptomyces sp. WMMC500 TaxID=3015154 RepID=UPI00248C8725|nr:TIGR03943 family protein [Streptomyces sp. WMMC500]WBB61902.1 TIGR03943 family protein [Streptomyces sp. WMMC500]